LTERKDGESLFPAFHHSPDYAVAEQALPKDLLIEALEADSVVSLRNAVSHFADACRERAVRGDVRETSEPLLSGTILEEHVRQILESRGAGRARYYIRRLLKAIDQVRTNGVNDINLNRWREYDEVITDSLWLLDRRDTSGAHLGWYWGNFVPQIPRQLMLRYTRRGDCVLDPFAGSGTTLIECRRMGRHGIGVELNEQVCARAKELVEGEPAAHGARTFLFNADSVEADFEEFLEEAGTEKIHLGILHPPYHDIIRFSDSPADLSNAESVERFVSDVGKVAEKVHGVLEDGRFLGVVIGDKYTGGEWVPLGFYVMQEVMRRGFSLKSTVVKNFEGTRGKRNQQALWRYRALAGGFYVFKHEYIFIFRKK